MSCHCVEPFHITRELWHETGVNIVQGEFAFCFPHSTLFLQRDQRVNIVRSKKPLTMGQPFVYTGGLVTGLDFRQCGDAVDFHEHVRANLASLRSAPKDIQNVFVSVHSASGKPNVNLKKILSGPIESLLVEVCSPLVHHVKVDTSGVTDDLAFVVLRSGGPVDITRALQSRGNMPLGRLKLCGDTDVDWHDPGWPVRDALENLAVEELLLAGCTAGFGSTAQAWPRCLQHVTVLGSLSADLVLGPKLRWVTVPADLTSCLDDTAADLERLDLTGPLQHQKLRVNKLKTLAFELHQQTSAATIKRLLNQTDFAHILAVKVRVRTHNVQSQVATLRQLFPNIVELCLWDVVLTEQTLDLGGWERLRAVKLSLSCAGWVRRAVRVGDVVAVDVECRANDYAVTVHAPRAVWLRACGSAVCWEAPCWQKQLDRGSFLTRCSAEISRTRTMKRARSHEDDDDTSNKRPRQNLPDAQPDSDWAAETLLMLGDSDEATTHPGDEATFSPPVDEDSDASTQPLESDNSTQPPTNSDSD